ncbi:MAG: AAA family ATPase, partial [Anaerolineales bacterium]
SCLAYARSRPLWIVAEILRNILRLAEPDPVEKQHETLKVYLNYLGLPASDLLPYLYTVLGLPQTDPETEMRLSLLDAAMLQRQTHAALRQVLVAEAHHAPTVLIFDDLHWVDPASRDFLEYLIQTSVDVPLLLVLVSRDLERQTVIAPVLALAQKHPARLLDIQLRPLSPDEAGQLIDQLLAQPSAALSALQARIVARADGNPFFIEELVRILIERGGLARSGETWEVPPGSEDLMQDVPGTLKGLILARFDRLPDQPRRRLQMAAVIGRSFPAGLLRHLNPAAPAGLTNDLALLTLRQFLADEAFGAEAGYSFRHALVQEAVYGTLLKRDLQRLHEQIAEAIETTHFWEGDERTEVLAYHFAESRSPARAVPYLLAAAQNAARRYANQTAIQHYRRAISLMQDAVVVQPAEMTRARLGLGQSLKFMGQFGEAAGVLAEAVLDIQRWPEVGAAAGLLLLTEALRELGDVRQREGAWEDAFAHLEAAQTALGENAAGVYPALWRPLMERMAWIRFRQGKVDEALRLARLATDGLDLKRS